MHHAVWPQVLGLQQAIENRNERGAVERRRDLHYRLKKAKKKDGQFGFSLSRGYSIKEKEK